jgi:citrate lyase subunit beta/citryl-CoA lyase
MLMRSLLFLPGNREKFLEKAVSLPADGFIVDFEDSVPAAEKANARKGLAAFAPALKDKSLWVRPNASDSPYFAEDLAAICATPCIAGLLLPKAERVAALREVDAAIGREEKAAGLAAGSLKVILTIETARGVIRALDLAEATARTESIAFGGAQDGDLMTDLGCAFSTDPGTLQHAREHVLIAARAAGCRSPLDSVFANVKDTARFEADTKLSRALGYRGRCLIHPSQIEPANRLYSPSAAEVAQSERLVEAFDAAVGKGHASVLFEGRMIDVAMAKAARNVIEWARQNPAERQGVPA